MGVVGQLVKNLEERVGLGGLPDAFLEVGGGVEEVAAADNVHEGVQESVEVTGGRVGEEVDALLKGLVAELPHLVPGGGNSPALFLKEAGVVEQAAGGVEHGGEVGLAVVVGVGGGSVGEALDDLVADGDIFAGDGHVEHVGDVGDELVVDELLGQAGFTAGGQVDDVGVVAALHGSADDVLEVALDGELNRDAGLGGEGVADLLPHSGIGLLVGALKSGYLDGGGGLAGAALGGSRIAGPGRGRVPAAGGEGKDHYQRQSKGKQLLQIHLHFPPCKNSLKYKCQYMVLLASLLRQVYRFPTR